MIKIKKIQVWIIAQNPQGEWLALLLKTTPERRSFWQPVTGHVEENENLIEAALREAKEETGYMFPSLPQSLNFEFEFKGKTFKGEPACFTETCFYIQISEENIDKSPVLDLKEHIEFKWTKFEDVEKFITYELNKEAFRLIASKLN